MVIEVKEKGSREFYEEVVNVISQYRYLIKNPERKLRSNLKGLRIYLIILVVMFILLLAMGFAWGFDTLDIVTIVALGIVGIFGCRYLISMKKLVNQMLDDKRTSTFTIDESGVELVKDGQTVKLAWENIAFVRMFKESMCFVASNVTSFVIALDRKHSAGVPEYIRDNNINVRYIEG